jgi:hypothetical protein
MSDISRMSITRDKLYEEVCAEPMAKVAVRAGPAPGWGACSTTLTVRWPCNPSGHLTRVDRRE